MMMVMMMMMMMMVMLLLSLSLPSSSDTEFVFVDGLLQQHHHHHHRRHSSRHRPTRSRRSDAFEHPMVQHQHENENENENEVQSTSSQPQSLERRRSFLSKMVVFSTVAATTFTIGGGDMANAAMMTIPLSLSSFPGSQSPIQQLRQQDNDRRQLELCLVNLLRLKYWSIGIIDRLNHQQQQQQQQQQDQTSTSSSATTETTTQSSAKTSAASDVGGEAVVKAAYLEARLGAKVIVAPKKKIGGGAGLSILTLKSLQIKDCLDDLRYYADRGGVSLSTSSSSTTLSKQQRKKLLIEQSEDLIEALASIVEFDGLETTQDDSPRSSLTLGMYNSQKGMYVRRMLSERVVPLVDSIVGTFGTDKLREADGYVNDYYAKEIPTQVY